MITPARATRGKPPWRGPSSLAAILLVLMSAACGPFRGPQIGRGASAATPALPTAVVIVSTPTASPSATPSPSPSTTPSTTPTATASPTATPVTPAEATATAEAALPPLDAERAAALQGVLDRAVADGYIPGAVAAVNIPGYQTWVGASGLADRQAGTPMTPETRVRIASISKTFTAATVLLLVEEGRLGLDDTLDTWFPELVPGAASITVRDLLQHTSGLYDFLEDPQFVNQAYREPDRRFAPAELVAYAGRFPAAFRPGAEGAWDYSSTNYVILGMIVEAVTGRPLAVEMRERIFEPLSLESTYFAPDEPIEGPFATGYGGSRVQRDVAMSFAYATANLVSTTDDVQRFGRALFAGDLLSAESQELMLSFVGGKGQYNMPELAYGLGVMRNALPVGRGAEESTVYGHIGGYGGFRSALWHAPASGVTIALGVNQALTDPNLLAAALFDATLDVMGR
jgi:D-alanyl-D-alanine carboxypeptidase